MMKFKKMITAAAAALVIAPVFAFTPPASANTDSHTEAHHHSLQRDKSLPDISTSLSVRTGNGTIEAGDRGITSSHVDHTEAFINRVALPAIKKNFAQLAHSVPQVNNPSYKVILFSHKNTYRNALVNAGVPTSDINNLVENTGGITDGTKIWIPLYAFNNRAEYAHYLAHEITHTVLHQAGLEAKLPVWLQEGISVYNGFTAHAELDPEGARELVVKLKESLRAHKLSGGVFSLQAGQEELLNAEYNVEALYSMAVNKLIKHRGVEGINKLLINLQSHGIVTSFQSAYGHSIYDFESSFLNRVNGSKDYLEQDLVNYYDDTQEVDLIIFNPGWRVSW
ncbi:hypothetical protein [Bacillus sp. SG-1]|uniref:hypothetical protein n=1 Tax=Bacillus sp. SG-1 TaxID=161544 RepID=UPI0001544588|nr:hypothetical protein [Bacillus sp. SG-1]EDL63843.1 hypothetical protein BSG1_13241 [Bacillus sp. SG-1]